MTDLNSERRAELRQGALKSRADGGGNGQA